MADVLNQCVKCKCSLSTGEKPSKLLPCLHALCEDCITGRTDAAEKQKLQIEGHTEEKPCSGANKSSDQNHDVAGHEAEADDSETKVREEDGEGKKAELDDGEGTGEPVQKIKGAAEETSMEGVEETSPDPVPMKECPLCKEAFDDDSLIDNVFLRKKTVVVPEPGDPTEQKCTGCETNAAASYCPQCGDWLCSDCVTAHKRVRMTKDHQLSSLEEAAASKASEGNAVAQTEMDLFCKHHPTEKLSLFCEKCEVLTCRDCQLLKHQEHKYHFLQDAADTYKLKLKGSVALMKERRNTLEKCLKEIEERLDSMIKDKSSLQQEILHQANVVVKAVRSSMWTVLSSLHSFTEAACKRLSREVGDVGNLVGKFDHCIDFIEAILEDGPGSSLLFSKAFVEAKCRKVYHTQMEPQSLKGQLNLKYHHDVPMFLRLLPNIGAIYINGTKYPPEKPPSQQSNVALSGNGAAAPDRGGGSFMKLAMSVPGQAGGSSMSLVFPKPPTGSRLVTAPTRGWPPAQVGNASSRLSVMGVMGPMAASQPHRMVLSSSSSASASSALPVMAMTLQQPRPAHSSTGPPPYPGTGGSTGNADGSQAAMSLTSGDRLAGTDLDPSPDPARPASEGRITPDRPLSSDGAASSVRVKFEHRNGKDCLRTANKGRGLNSSRLVAATLGEMQRNLDDVIRSVPLDLSDQLQPINSCHITLAGGASSTPITSAAPPPSSLPFSPLLTAAMSKPAESSPISLAVAVTPVRPGQGEREEGTHSNSAQDGSAVDNQKGKRHSAGGGNRLPPFPLLPARPGGDLGDPNDDYCAVCHQGGDVLCCDNCPRVFHLQCHVPVLSVVPSGAFNCTLCEDSLVLEATEDGPVEVVGGKRKAPTGILDRELKVCERVLLELFCHPSSLPFHEPVNRAIPNYYKIITSPMDFTNIKCKLSRSHFNHYATVQSFLDDCKLVFRNCAVYNAEKSEVGKAGLLVKEFFQELVSRHMPHLSSYASRPQGGDSGGESERKRRRIASSTQNANAAAAATSDSKGK